MEHFDGDIDALIAEPEMTTKVVKTETRPIGRDDRDDDTPWQHFNANNSLKDVLEREGWKSAGMRGDNEHWTRPGKSGGTSGTLKDGCFYAFTSSTELEANRGYDAWGFHVFSKHRGDFKKAAAEYRKQILEDSTTVENVRNCGQIIPPDALTIRDLATFVTSHDPNTLLGNRWLCKGGGALLIGQAGLGKSSLAMQAMILWALGLEVFGIKPVRPLKVLLIQAENDKGDLAEMVQGVLKGLGLEDRIDELNERLVFITEDARTGKDFALMLRAAVEKHKSDIAIADPLLAYIGGNISDQETVSAFLRNQINPVLHETGAALVFVHHTNKPAKDPAQRNSFVGGDFAYLGTGSAELANWARAVLVVREMKEGLYELRGAKRGKRSGLPKDDSGQGYTQLLKHGEKGICWEVATDAEAEIESAISNGEVLAVLDEIGKPSPSGKGWRWADVIKAIQDATGRKKEAAKKFFREHVARHLNQSAVGIYSVKQGTKVPEGTFKVR